MTTNTKPHRLLFQSMTDNVWQTVILALLVCLSLFTSGCADKSDGKTAKIAFSVNPHHKALGSPSDGRAIPAEITSLTVKLYHGDTQLDATDLVAKAGKATFYAPINTPLHLRSDAYNGAEHLFTGHADIAPLNEGETRPVTLALNSIIQIELAELSNPNPSPVNVTTAHQFKIQATGLQNTTIDWYVNGVKGGNNELGIIDTDGVYTPPARAMTQTVVVRAVPVAAPSFAKEVPVELDIFVNQAPTITLNGATQMVITQNSVFNDPGATAQDAEDGDLTRALQINGQVDPSVLGSYTLTYRVADQDGATTENVRSVSVVINPPTRAAVLQANTGDGEVTLTWSAVPGASEYRLYRSTGANADPVGTPLATLTNTRHTDQSVSNGTPYVYIVVAANSAGVGAVSNQVSARPLLPLSQLPTAPGNLSATAGTGQVTLTWLASTNSTGYHIYRGTSANVSTTDPAFDVVAGTVTQYVDSRVLNDNTYFYKVVAVNSVGAGPASREALAAVGRLIVMSSFTDAALKACVQNLGKQYVHELTDFRCYGRGIKSLAGVEQLTALRGLNLESNQIVDITPLAGLTALTTLKLGSNQIVDVAPLAALTRLTFLSLGDGIEPNQNSVAELSPIRGLASLTELYFGGNKITDLSSLANLTELATLHLASNQIVDSSPIAALSRLSSLDLSNNECTNLAPLAQLTALTSLKLAKNRITDISPLAKLNALTSLNLGVNQISDISPLAGLVTLTELNLQLNQIADISPLSRLTNLTGLHLIFNSVTDLSPLAQLKSLTWIALWHNQIRDISPLSSLTSLTQIGLSENLITDISPLSNLTSLTYLELRQNGIVNISPLRGLKSLSHLDLRENQISDISPLAELPNLPSLLLSSNKIADISPLAQLADLYYLDLGSNRIIDLSPLLQLPSWRLNELVLDNNPISCGSVEQLDALHDTRDGPSTGVVKWSSCSGPINPVLTETTNYSRINRELPWNGTQVLTQHTFDLSDLSPSRQYTLSLYNLTNDFDLYVYSDSSRTKLACSSARGGASNESCLSYPNAEGHLYIVVVGPPLTYTLNVN